jgi:hypothetical protein
MSLELQTTWRQPPPGTEIVTTSYVKPGDWFYIESLGAWGPVPECALGEPVTVHPIARSHQAALPK